MTLSKFIELNYSTPNLSEQFRLPHCQMVQPTEIDLLVNQILVPGRRYRTTCRQLMYTTVSDWMVPLHVESRKVKPVIFSEGVPNCVY